MESNFKEWRFQPGISKDQSIQQFLMYKASVFLLAQIRMAQYPYKKFDRLCGFFHHFMSCL